MKGRPPKPTSLRVLQGNPGHRKVEDGNEPAPPEGAPEPPDFLSPAAKAQWFHLIGIMSQVPGWLTKMDANVLTLFCSAAGEFEEAEIGLPKLKKKYVRARGEEKGRILNEINLLKGQRRQAMKDMKANGTEFGWSAVSRTRMRISAGQGELDLTGAGSTPGPESPFEKTQRLAQRA